MEKITSVHATYTCRIVLKVRLSRSKGLLLLEITFGWLKNVCISVAAFTQKDAEHNMKNSLY